ncbi:MAG: hypothetical protein KC476_06730 [Cyanobacteria bacterium HKST-UBA06]|nr:hypothetical protein [Cyanobacteria bacterium HKST-UBA06]
MKPTHTHLVLNKLSPLKRRSVMTWFYESSQQHRGLRHQSFLNSFSIAHRRAVFDQLQHLHDKIAFTLLHEFGPQFARRPIFSTLVREVAGRIQPH